jgi:hypothetical protein
MMAEPISKSMIQVADWPGLISNTGPMAGQQTPGSAAELVNLQCNVPGQMATRLGLKKVEFDSE